MTIAPPNRIIDFRQGGSRIVRHTFCGFCLVGGVKTQPDDESPVYLVCSTCQSTPHKTMADYLTSAERVEAAFPIALTNDNDGGSRHFNSSPARDRRKRRLGLVRDFQLLGFYRNAPPLYKQRITLTRMLGPKQSLWDWDSVLRGNAKEIIDSLVELKFTFNDNPRWIVGVHGEQDETQREFGRGVRILIERAG